MCKPGLARILVEFVDMWGVTNQWVICGSVRTSSRDDTGAYTYLDPDTVTTDQIANQEFQCFPSKYYEQVFPMEYSFFSTTSYYPRKYQNVTDNLSEILCVPNEPFISKRCKHQTVAPDATYLATLTDDTQQTQVNVIAITVGCNACTDDQIPLIQYNTVWGIYYQTCELKQKYDFSKDDVPCKNLGYVQVW